MEKLNCGAKKVLCRAFSPRAFSRCETWAFGPGCNVVAPLALGFVVHDGPLTLGFVGARRAFGGWVMLAHDAPLALGFAGARRKFGAGSYWQMHLWG
jgi:hypothetical protein